MTKEYKAPCILSTKTFQSHSTNRFVTMLAMANIADRIKIVLRESNLTQTELARKIGVKQQAIQYLCSGRANRTRYATDIEKATGFNADWINTGRGPMRPELKPDGLIVHRDAARKIPVISYIEAGNWQEVVDAYSKGDGFDSLNIDAAVANTIGPYAFALEVHGESMLPDFRPGDRVIVDPDASVRPGDIVVAKLDREESATLKKYRSRGTDSDGKEVFELVPLNDDYPTLVVNSSNPGKVIGPVVEHRKRFR